MFVFLRKAFRLSAPMHRALAIGLVFAILMRLCALVLPASTKFLVDDILIKQQFHLLAWYLVITIGASALQGTSAFVAAWVLGRAHQDLLAEVRARAQAHVLSLPLTYHDSRKTGALVSAIMHDVEGLPRLFGGGIVQVGAALSGALAAFVILTSIEPVLATGGLIMILLYVFLSRHAVRKARLLHLEHHETQASVAGRLQETLAGVRVVKAYVAERHEQHAFETGTRQLRDIRVKALLTAERLHAASIVIAGSGTAIILYSGAREVAAGTLSVGGLMAFSSVLFLLIAPITELAGVGPVLSKPRPAPNGRSPCSARSPRPIGAGGPPVCRGSPAAWSSTTSASPTPRR